MNCFIHDTQKKSILHDNFIQWLKRRNTTATARFAFVKKQSIMALRIAVGKARKKMIMMMVMDKVYPPTI